MTLSVVPICNLLQNLLQNLRQNLKWNGHARAHEVRGLCARVQLPFVKMQSLFVRVPRRLAVVRLRFAWALLLFATGARQSFAAWKGDVQQQDF